jgi:hypothetical protein
MCTVPNEGSDMSTTSGYSPGTEARGADPAEGRGFGWMVFAGIILSISGILNVIWGIAAISNSKFFVQGTHYVISDLKTWGWVTLIVGVLQFGAAMSLFGGRTYGRIFAIVAASFSAIAALLSIPAYPFWSLAVFAISFMVIYGCSVYDSEAARY